MTEIDQRPAVQHRHRPFVPEVARPADPQRPPRYVRRNRPLIHEVPPAYTLFSDPFFPWIVIPEPIVSVPVAPAPLE